jgi:hypothetical protein
LLDDIADDLLPFEEISKLQLQETPIEGPGRLLKSKKGKLTLSSSVTDMNYDQTIKMLRNRSAKTYKDQEPKTVQLESVMDLINRRDTFVLAGTGVGKSRIAENRDVLGSLPQIQKTDCFGPESSRLPGG